MQWLAYRLECGTSWIQTPVGQTKDNEMGICCFGTKHAVLTRKSKDWLAQNQDNLSEWGDMSLCGLLFQCASTIINPTKGCCSTKKRTASSSHWKLTCSRHDIYTAANLALSYNHSLTHFHLCQRWFIYLRVIISHPHIGFSDFIQSSHLEDGIQSTLSATLAI